MNAINSREDCTSSLLAKEFNVKKVLSQLLSVD